MSRDYQIITLPCWVAIDADATNPGVLFDYGLERADGRRYQRATLTYAIDGKSRGRLDTLTPLHDRVYASILKRGTVGWTDQECQDFLSMGPQTQIPVRLTLERLGYVVWNQQYRATRSGKRAKVWVATNKEYPT